MLCLLVRVVLRFPLCSVGVPNGLLCEPWGLLLRFLGPSFFGLFWGAQRGPLLPVTCLSCCFGHLRGPRGPSRFLIGLLTLIVLWGPASELSISVKKNLVRAFLYLFLDPARWLPAGGRCAIFPPPPSPSRSLSPPLLLLSFTLGWAWGGSLVVSKNRSPPRLFLDPDFPDFSHFLYCVHRWSIYPIAWAILHSQQQGEKLSAVAIFHHMLQLIVDLAGLSKAKAGWVSLLTRP